MDATGIQRTVETVWRMEAPKIIAVLARYTGDIGLAEDIAQDALVTALERWPESGVPENPAAWLTLVAKRRAVDDVRRIRMQDRKHGELAYELASRVGDNALDVDSLPGERIDDDLLRLMFTCCHPILSREARIALTLRTLGGLTTEEIARAFLVQTATVAQRIVRAKRTLRDAKAVLEAPEGDERAARLSTVLEVIYLVFNEGYSATAGDSWIRPELCMEALRLARILAELAPEESEVHGLAALLELQASRLRTRVGPGGEPVLLQDQDRARWDRLLIRRGMAALNRALALGRGLGPYGLQAAISACHAQAPTAAATDWRRIVALYDALLAATSSPVVGLNRAVAVAMAFGPRAGLDAVDELTEEPALQTYPLLPAVRGDLLARVGRFQEATAELKRAATLTLNHRERELLLKRAKAAARGEAPEPWPGGQPGQEPQNEGVGAGE